MGGNTPGADRAWRPRIRRFAVSGVFAALLVAAAFFVYAARGCVDLEDESWPVEMAGRDIALYGMEFPLNAAFSYGGDGCRLRVTYITREKLSDIKAHYMKALDSPEETGLNNIASFSLKGSLKGRGVSVRNYFSELAHIVTVEIEQRGRVAESIKKRVVSAFPERELAENSRVLPFTASEAVDGYVLYNYDTFATDSYTGTPIFSRRYGYHGTSADLSAEIEALGTFYAGASQAVIEDDSALIKDNGYLYTIMPFERDGQVYTVITAQRIPEKK
ncbi:MAG: hypothetical protein LBS35_06900 [Synergistaceae bacterium]|nr:hypothetical protein [Synergistaceae bacterium]